MKQENYFKTEAAAFEKLLEKLNPETISPDDYCCRYLSYLISHKKYFISIYAVVLGKLIDSAAKKPGSISLVDLGAGNGLLGLFAKYCGFKKVFINDIEEKFVDASANLAQQLEISIDGFIKGDIQSVSTFFNHEFPDAIIGTDVIEHIYDLNDFFDTIIQINPSMLTVFTTASNPQNYFKIRSIKKLQRRDEFEGGSPGDFILFGDKPLEPFLETRKKIIRTKLESINDETIHQLAIATRGMNEKDIIKVALEFKINGKIPTVLSHPTNTCNPVTGSWTEHILSIREYGDLYNNHRMNLKIDNGFYDINKQGFKKNLNKLLNVCVSCFGIQFAPFIIFTGSKK